MTTFVIGGALGAMFAFALSYVIARWRELTKRAPRMAEYPESLRLGRRNPGYRMDSRGITRAADGALILPPSHEPGMLPKVDRPGERITVAPAVRNEYRYTDAYGNHHVSSQPAAKVRPEVQARADVIAWD